MSHPSRALTPAALVRLVLVLACSMLPITIVPGSAAAQTHHRTRTHHRAGGHRRHTGAHSARLQRDGSRQGHNTSGRRSSSNKHRGDGSAPGGVATTPPPVAVAPGAPTTVSSGAGSTSTTGSAPGGSSDGPASTTGSGSSSESAPTGESPPISESPQTPAPSGESPPVSESSQTPLAAFPGGGRPFAALSPWNVPIPTDPVVDPNSATIAGYLGSEGKAYADLYEYGNPVWDAYAGTPRYDITCTEPWGSCPLSRAPVPMPASAGASSGSDGSMVVIDWSTRIGYDFWRARKTSSGWTAAWGTVFSIDGNGIEDGATGAGMPLLGGMIRTYEIQQGYIDHALTFSTDNACTSVLRYPASKTDGDSSRSNCIPEGARVQLDPSIDVDTIPGITPGERAVAHALQTYGAYADNNGGAKMSFSFENPAGKPDPYPAAGFAWDYYDMPHVPWNRLRVLRAWNGS
jgi:hypothetical protein